MIKAKLACFIPVTTIAQWMLWFCYLSWIESEPSLSLLYLSLASTGFTLQVLGYYAYLRYYVPKNQHSVLYAILYTMVYGVVFLRSRSTK